MIVRLSKCDSADVLRQQKLQIMCGSVTVRALSYQPCACWPKAVPMHHGELQTASQCACSVDFQTVSFSVRICSRSRLLAALCCYVCDKCWRWRRDERIFWMT